MANADGAAAGARMNFEDALIGGVVDAVTAVTDPDGQPAIKIDMKKARDGVRDACTLRDEKGWVIERHIHSQLHYWTGRPYNGIPRWSPKHQDAVRFARRADAELMLTYHCDGEGNVVEHLWSLR